MQAPATLLCAKCGEAADGWKCAICGSVAREHDPGHLQVGSDRYCTPEVRKLRPGRRPLHLHLARRGPNRPDARHCRAPVACRQRKLKAGW
jgi:hypothetical protein